jgi:plasmid maintenance system killer protein
VKCEVKSAREKRELSEPRTENHAEELQQNNLRSISISNGSSWRLVMEEKGVKEAYQTNKGRVQIQNGLLHRSA